MGAVLTHSLRSRTNTVQQGPLSREVFPCHRWLTDAPQGHELWPQIIQKCQIAARVADRQPIQRLASAAQPLVSVFTGSVLGVVCTPPVNRLQSLWDWES